MFRFMEMFMHEPKTKYTFRIMDEDGKIVTTNDPDEFEAILTGLLDKEDKEEEDDPCKDCEGDCYACADVASRADFCDDEDDDEDEEDGELVFDEDELYEPEMTVLAIPASGVLAAGVAAGSVLCGVAAIIRALKK